jgi:hypothetical protein
MILLADSSKTISIQKHRARGVGVANSLGANTATVSPFAAKAVNAIRFAKHLLSRFGYGHPPSLHTEGLCGRRISDLAATMPCPLLPAISRMITSFIIREIHGTKQERKS